MNPHAANWTVIFVPLVLQPLVILILGLAWMLASLGVFPRDVGQTISIITGHVSCRRLLPRNCAAGRIPPLAHGQPITFIIEQSREMLIWARLPDWLGLGIYTLAAAAIAWAGYA